MDADHRIVPLLSRFIDSISKLPNAITLPRPNAICQHRKTFFQTSNHSDTEIIIPAAIFCHVTLFLLWCALIGWRINIRRGERPTRGKVGHVVLLTMFLCAQGFRCIS